MISEEDRRLLTMVQGLWFTVQVKSLLEVNPLMKTEDD